MAQVIDDGGSGSTTLYYWAKLNYNANGGSGGPSAVTATTNTSGGNVTFVLTGPYPSRQYYTCNGWAFSSSATSGQTPGTPLTVAASTTSGQSNAKNYTLYAAWTHDTAQVIFSANGGSGAPSTITHWAGYSVTIPETVPTRSGYTFLGWSKSSTATSPTYYPGKDYALYTTVTLYAVWQQNDYIYVNVNGTWKKAIPYVKVNGTWKKSTKAYVKVNGTWRTL